MSSVFFYSVIYTIQEEENPSGFYVDPQRHKSVFPNKKNRNQVFTLNSYNLLISKRLSAERQGFEPRIPRGTTVFKTAAIDHSATSPKLFSGVLPFKKRCKGTHIF